MFAPDAEGFSAISIHAPRMGSDPVFWHGNHPASEFQSTLPGWGATGTRYNTAYSLLFQSTLPGWGATGSTCPASRKWHFNPRSPDGERLSCVRDNAAYIDISIHAPRMGSDVLTNFRVSAHAHFNPRSPDGERPYRDGLTTLQLIISIHAPRMGSDAQANKTDIARQISIHAPRMGSDMELLDSRILVRISIHAPRMGSDR